MLLSCTFYEYHFCVLTESLTVFTVVTVDISTADKTQVIGPEQVVRWVRASVHFGKVRMWEYKRALTPHPPLLFFLSPTLSTTISP